MLKIKMGYTLNFIALLIGVVMSLGFGTKHPAMLIVYGVFMVFLFLTRTRYWYLPLITTVITLMLWGIAFEFSIASSVSFMAGKAFTYTFITVSIVSISLYFILNTLELKGMIGHAYNKR